MTIPGFVAPFLGFAVIVTLALAGYCTWVYWTTGDDGLQQCTKRLRVLYRAGMVITLVSVLCGVSLLLYAIGAAILKVV